MWQMEYGTEDWDRSQAKLDQIQTDIDAKNEEYSKIMEEIDKLFNDKQRKADEAAAQAAAQEQQKALKEA